MESQFNHGLTGNFLFSVGNEKRLTFAVQSTNIADAILGLTSVPSIYKDVFIPSNKLETETLICQFICDTHMTEWVQIYKWMLKCKNNPNRGLSADYFKQCELTILDEQNQPSTRFIYQDTFPFTIDALQFTTINESEVLTFTAVFRYIDFKVVDRNGNEITYDWDGEL